MLAEVLPGNVFLQAVFIPARRPFWIPSLSLCIALLQQSSAADLIGSRLLSCELSKCVNKSEEIVWIEKSKCDVKSTVTDSNVWRGKSFQNKLER